MRVNASREQFRGTIGLPLRDYLWVAAPRTGIEEANRARGCVFEEASVVERVIDECGGARPRVEARDDGGARPRAGRVVDDPRDILGGRVDPPRWLLRFVEVVIEAVAADAAAAACICASRCRNSRSRCASCVAPCHEVSFIKARRRCACVRICK